MLPEIKYCSRCVYPDIAVNLSFDGEGICSSCRVFEQVEKISEQTWFEKKEKFIQIVNETIKNNKSDYDCVIPVSGGKDSYYQTHVMIEELGLKPLLVTYHGNNFLSYGKNQMPEAIEISFINTKFVNTDIKILLFYDSSYSFL